MQKQVKLPFRFINDRKKETDERQKGILLSRDQRQNNDIGVDFVMFCITITANPAGSNVDPLVEVNGQV